MTAPTRAPRRAPLSVLDAAALRRWLFRARDALGRHRHRLDALNVYPVPDGDTGTNLYLTLDGGLRGFMEALMGGGRARGVPDVVSGAAALARASLLAARGNSGVILSQLIAGLASSLATHSRGAEAGIDGRVLAAVLEEADRRARDAVVDPVEGTILTVVTAAADAARHTVDSGRAELVSVVDAVCTAARGSLRRTTGQLPVLARAGVVDAGAAGFVIILEALASVVRGQPAGDLDVAPGNGVPLAAGGGAHPVSSDPDTSGPETGDPEGGAAGRDRSDTTRDAGSGPTSFEVMYLLDGLEDQGAATLREVLGDLGDSLVVAGDRELRSVHVHTGDPGAAIEAALDVGRPYGIRVSLLDPGEEGCSGDVATGDADASVVADDGVSAPGPGGRAAAGENPAPRLGVVACVSAPGLTSLVEESGAVVLEEGAPRPLTPADLVRAARATRAERVVLLSSSPETALLAEAAVSATTDEADIDLAVLPTRHVVQCLAALAVYAPDEAVSEERMRQAAREVRCGSVVRVPTSTGTDAADGRTAEVVGRAEGHLVTVGDEVHVVAEAVVEHLRGESGELVTLVEGAGAPGSGAEVARGLTELGVDVEVYVGGQSGEEMSIGVEG